MIKSKQTSTSLNMLHTMPNAHIHLLSTAYDRLAYRIEFFVHAPIENNMYKGKKKSLKQRHSTEVFSSIRCAANVYW